jgi:cytoskeletal protein CcmA (bactofilin family)
VFQALCCGVLGEVAAMSDLFVVGPDVRIWGTISSLVPVEVLGFVDGGVIAPQVHVMQKAMVTGDIIATQATVSGQVLGNIFADNIVLEETSSIEGEIYHKSLDLRAGAHFEGKSRHHDKPKSLATALSIYDHTHAT